MCTFGCDKLGMISESRDTFDVSISDREIEVMMYEAVTFALRWNS